MKCCESSAEHEEYKKDALVINNESQQWLGVVKREQAE
jgi:hypothetical protein